MVAAKACRLIIEMLGANDQESELGMSKVAELQKPTRKGIYIIMESISRVQRLVQHAFQESVMMGGG